MRSAPTIGRRHRRQTVRAGSPYLRDDHAADQQVVDGEEGRRGGGGAEEPAGLARGRRAGRAPTRGAPCRRPPRLPEPPLRRWRGSRTGRSGGCRSRRARRQGPAPRRGRTQHGREDREVVQADRAAPLDCTTTGSRQAAPASTTTTVAALTPGGSADQEPEDREGARDRQAHRVHAVSEGQSLHPGDDSVADRVAATRSEARNGPRPGGFCAPSSPIGGRGASAATSGRRPFRPGRRGAR